MNLLDDQRAVAGSAVSLAIPAYAEGVSLTFSATGLPSGLSINTTTGVISGTIAVAAAAATPYAVTVTATDGTNSIDRSFDWTVGSLAADQTSEEGDVVGFQVGSGDLTGPLAYGATDLPDGLSLDAETGWLSGTVEASAAGTYAVSLSVGDTNGMTLTQEITWVVTSKYGLLAEQVDSTGVWRVTGSSTETFGAAVNEPMELSFQLTDRLGNQASTGAVTFTATGLPDGVWLTATATGFLLEGTPTQAALTQGTHAVTVLATDGVSSVSRDFFFVIAPVPRTRVTVELRLDVNFEMALKQAAAVVTDPDKVLVLDRDSIDVLVKLQAETDFLDSSNVFEEDRVAFATVIGEYDEDFRSRFAAYLRVEGALREAEVLGDDLTNVTRWITELGDEDIKKRNAASANLAPFASRIYQRLQNLRARSADAEVRLRAGALADAAEQSAENVLRLIRALPNTSQLNEVFDAKAFLLNIATGAQDGLLTNAARNTYSNFP